MPPSRPRGWATTCATSVRCWAGTAITARWRVSWPPWPGARTLTPSRPWPPATRLSAMIAPRQRAESGTDDPARTGSCGEQLVTRPGKQTVGPARERELHPRPERLTSIGHPAAASQRGAEVDLHAGMVVARGGLGQQHRRLLQQLDSGIAAGEQPARPQRDRARPREPGRLGLPELLGDEHLGLLALGGGQHERQIRTPRIMHCAEPKSVEHGPGGAQDVCRLFLPAAQSADTAADDQRPRPGGNRLVPRRHLERVQQVGEVVVGRALEDHVTHPPQRRDQPADALGRVREQLQDRVGSHREPQGQGQSATAPNKRRHHRSFRSSLAAPLPKRRAFQPYDTSARRRYDRARRTA